ncbi:MAG: SH3 domain-containing protein [Clostridium sp.]|nr:SH3 domain-containing protein [Clostridium sp.]
MDQNGKVTAVSGGVTNVLVTDGSKKAVCIVRVSASGTLTTTPDSSPSDSTSGSTSGLKAGAAVVINGGNGVRVRSGPGTSYEILASVPNGADIQVVKSAGDGWYEITFDNVGGVKTTGYMKGDFLKNK